MDKNQNKERTKKTRTEEDTTNVTGSNSSRQWSLEVPDSSVMFVPRQKRGAGTNDTKTSALSTPVDNTPMPSTSRGQCGVEWEAPSCKLFIVGANSSLPYSCPKPWTNRITNSRPSSDKSKKRLTERHDFLQTDDGKFDSKMARSGTGRSRTDQAQPKHDTHQRHRKVKRAESCSGGSSSTSCSFYIPGFYYDPVKQKYFKILPNTGNASLNIVTKETIARDKAEARRQADIKSFELGRKSATKTAAFVKPVLQKQKVCQILSHALLGAYQRGEIGNYRLHNLFTMNTAIGLRPAGCAMVFPGLQGPQERLEHMHQMEISQDHEKILCLWSIRGTMMERLQLVTLREASRTCPGHLSLVFDPSGTTVVQSWNKITNVCWADFPQFPGEKYVLYTTMCHTSQAYSLAFIRNLDPGYRDDIHFSDFNLGTKATWTCAWNGQKQQFSVGTEKGCLVIDISTRQLWQFKTHNSDTLAQVFSKEDGGNLMYTGTRRGHILLHDLRSSSTLATTLMSHKSSLACLRLSMDESYLYASDFSGKINKWDLRMRETVLSYEGLYNQYSKLPFNIDETESILYGAGQDCYSKIWMLDTGKLLLSVPPPCTASRDTIPALQFSTHWAGSPGNAGLLLGVLDKFYLYGTGLEEGAALCGDR